MSTTRRAPRGLRTLVLGLGILAGLLCAVPIAAQNEREIEAVKQRIQQLRRHAEELQKAGQMEAAKEAGAQARSLTNRLEKGVARQRQERGGELEGVLDHLERAIVGLRKLGDIERAEHLTQFTRELAQDLRRRTARERPAAGERGADAERREAKRQLEVFRYAKSAFAEKEMRDAMELVERAMHARELAIEGRRDAEAMLIRRNAPNRGAQIELLQKAAAILREYRATEKAVAVHQLAEKLATQTREQRAPERERRLRAEEARRGDAARAQAERARAAQRAERAEAEPVRAEQARAAQRERAAEERKRAATQRDEQRRRAIAERDRAAVERERQRQNADRERARNEREEQRRRAAEQRDQQRAAEQRDRQRAAEQRDQQRATEQRDRQRQRDTRDRAAPRFDARSERSTSDASLEARLRRIERRLTEIERQIQELRKGRARIN